jgi:hypothetical protein
MLLLPGFIQVSLSALCMPVPAPTDTQLDMPADRLKAQAGSMMDHAEQLSLPDCVPADDPILLQQ